MTRLRIWEFLRHVFGTEQTCRTVGCTKKGDINNFMCSEHRPGERPGQVRDWSGWTDQGRQP